MKKVNAKFFGENVTNNGYGKLSAIFDTKDNKLSAFANHAAFEYVVNGDRDFLDKLFQCEKLLLKSGELNAEGRNVAQYVQHFAPITIGWKKEAGALVIAKTKNKALKHSFYTGEKQGKERVTVVAADTPQWPLTIAQLKAQKDNAPKDENKPQKAASVKALTSRTAKLLESLETVEPSKAAGADLADLLAQLTEAKARVDAMITANVKFSREQNAAIDGDQTHELQPFDKPSGSSKRADTDRAKHAETV